jgi:aminoglycoside 6'-N-acetyltransferase
LPAEVVFDLGDLHLRRLVEADIPVMLRWLQDPRVLEWYEGRDRSHDEAMVREHYFVDDETTRCIVEFEGRPIGYQQFYPVLADERAEYGLPEDEAIWGMDQFIGEVDLWSRGLGTRLVNALTDHLFEHQGAERVVMDPQQRNHRALRCYEKAGYVRARALPRHELHEGVPQDCWLIERRRTKRWDVSGGE